MKLLRLHLQGFKSFKDKTTINFDDGITGIVGPNGCGKSNIVDALFWVMGEQSAKHLRGNKMKDLIFAGSSKYTPASFAEVTLVLENDTGKHIHIGNQVLKPLEIALTRKLYRNGETEYRINNLPARLKDIQEVFMDTGAGAKSYSIIAQGEINRLVQAKPVERRTMIEEVAGITKFKMRKKESMKKIEQTQSNLNRLSDLQSEIYKHLKSLEKQAEKAEKAKRLRDRIKHHELIVKSHKEFDFLSDFVNAKTNLNNNELIVEQGSLRKDQLELALEDERIKKTDLIEKIDEHQAEFNELSKELAASEERLKHLKRSCSDKEKHIADRSKENEELEGDIEARSTKLEELKEKLRDLEAQNFDEMDFSELEEKVESYKETLTEKEEMANEISVSLEEAKTEFNEVDQVIFRNNSKLEEYSANLEDIFVEIEEIETNTANFSDEIVKQREDTQVAKEALLELETKFGSVKQEYDNKKTLLKEKDLTQRALSKEVIQLESKVNSLKEVSKNGEGVKEGALKFIEESETTSFELLGNVIECEAEYAKALEVLFEDSFDSLIGKSNDVNALGEWNQANLGSSFDFIMPDAGEDKCGDETIERLKIKGCDEVIAIDSILKINNAEYESSLKEFFNGFYIVNNLTAELALKISNTMRFKGLVSLDGNVYLNITNNGVKLSARSADTSTMGVVQRNNLINELSVDLEDKSGTLEALDLELNELTTRVDELTLELDLVSKELNETNTKYVSLKSSLESKEVSFGSTSSRLEILTNRKTEISKSKLDLLEVEEDVATRKDTLEAKVETLSEQSSEIKDEIDELRSLYENSRGELLELQANAKTYQSQIDNFQSQITDVESQVLRYNEKLEQNNDLLNQYEQEIEEAENAVVLLEEANSEQADVMSEKENFLNIVKDDLTSLLADMQDRENEVKEITGKVNKIEKSNVELNLKVEQIIIDEEILVKDMFERYKVDLRDVLQAHLEIHSDKIDELSDLTEINIVEAEDGSTRTIEKEAYAFDKKFPAVLRESREKFKRYRTDLNRLGEINWQAIEDYDRQKLRYEFLKAQELELKKSLEDLELAINHIDEKSKIRFKEAYNEVNVRFEKVFPIIFGGGEARLEIVGDVDSPECGIEIIAKPPGKKMQSINLMSGGEKAMTAVSLIFSIFLVKPSPFCLLDEVDAPLDDANVGRFNELLREMSAESQFILITHNKKTMELNDMLYGVTMQEPGVSKAVSVQLH
ncbi:MAG: chromosome segregation protein [Bacteriovoracaceae bacterium]|jgi:chromosome segregation protein